MGLSPLAAQKMVQGDCADHDAALARGNAQRRVQPRVGQAVDNQRRGGKILATAVFAGHGHGERARGGGGQATVSAVLQYGHLGRRHAETPGRGQINLRMWFALSGCPPPSG